MKTGLSQQVYYGWWRHLVDRTYASDIWAALARFVLLSSRLRLSDEQCMNVPIHCYHAMMIALTCKCVTRLDNKIKEQGWTC